MASNAFWDVSLGKVAKMSVTIYVGWGFRGIDGISVLVLGIVVILLMEWRVATLSQIPII